MSEVDLTQLAIDRTVPQTRANRHRHLLTRYVLPCAMLAGFLALVLWLARDILFPPHPVTVVPVLATQADLQQEGTPLFQAAGWIEPRPTMVRVAALAPGVVEKLLVVEDQAVEAGEPIAELIKADAELAHDRAVADRKLREAELEEVQATLTAAITRLQQPVHLQAALGQADASLAEIDTELTNLPFELRRAEAQKVFAQKNHDGKESAGGAVSGRSLDAAKSLIDTANAFVEELRGRRDSLKRQQSALTMRRNALQKQLELLADEVQARDEAKAQVKAAQAHVELANVVVAEARLQLQRMTIRAPIAGRVFQLLGHPGSRLSAEARNNGTHDSSTVVTMYRPDMLQVRVDVRFEDIPKVALGQSVRINNPALSEPLTGAVLFISSEADIQKNTLQVKVAIPSPPPVFKPEMLVDVTFLAAASAELSEASNEKMRLFLPRQLVQQENGEKWVWLADQSHRVARKTVVKTGMAGPHRLIEISEGLMITSRVIRGGSDNLHDGQRIHITGEDLETVADPFREQIPDTGGTSLRTATGVQD